MIRCASFLLFTLCVSGCGGKPDKVAVEKAVREGLAAASPDWKQITFETKLNDTSYAVGSMRAVGGKDFWFNFTGGGDSGGVAVRTPDNKLLCKYLFENGKEVSASKLDGGSEDDIAKFRTTATEFATAILKATK